MDMFNIKVGQANKLYFPQNPEAKISGVAIANLGEYFSEEDTRIAPSKSPGKSKRAVKDPLNSTRDRAQVSPARLLIQNMYAPLSTEEGELSDDESSSSETATEDQGIPPLGKRTAPDDGHSPREKPKRRYKTIDKRPENKLTRVEPSVQVSTALNQPPPNPSLREDSSRKQPEKSQMEKTKYSFIVKATEEIQLGRLAIAIGKVLPRDSVIIRHVLAKSKTVALFKTVNKTADNPSYDLNYLLKPEVKNDLVKRYGDETIEIHYYDPTRKMEETDDSNHAILKNVPLEYTDDELLKLIESECDQIGENIKYCKRIISAETGRPTSLIRLICKDKDTAEVLLKEGLKIGSLVFRCERPLPRPTPIRCYKCQEFNHTSYQCQNTQKCAKCGEEHRTKDCQKTKDEYRCINCGERHAVWAKTCNTNIAAIQEEKRKKEMKRVVPPAIEQPVPRAWQNLGQQNAEQRNEMTNQELGTNTLIQELKAMKQEIKDQITAVHRSLVDRMTQFTETVTEQIRQIPQEIKQQLTKDPVTNNTLVTVNEKMSEETKKIQKLVQGNMDSLDDFTTSYGKELDKLSEIIEKTEKLTEDLLLQQSINNEMFTALPGKIHETCHEMVQTIGTKSRSTSAKVDRRRSIQTSLTDFQAPSPRNNRQTYLNQDSTHENNES